MIALLARDLKLAVRSGGGFGLGLGFCLILVVLTAFSVEDLTPVAPGIIWIGALLSCLLSLDRIFALDFEDGTLDALTVMPLEAVVAIKALAHWITSCLPVVIMAPLFGFLLNLAPSAYLWLCLGLLIGTPALSIIGAFGAALTVGLKRGGLLLSVLILPLYIPTLIFGAELTRRGAEGLDVTLPLLLQAATTLGSVGLLPYAAAAALKVALR